MRFTRCFPLQLKINSSWDELQAVFNGLLEVANGKVKGSFRKELWKRKSLGELIEVTTLGDKIMKIPFRIKRDFYIFWE